MKSKTKEITISDIRKNIKSAGLNSKYKTKNREKKHNNVRI